MKLNTVWTQLLAVGLIGTTFAAPMSAVAAQHKQHQQTMKNQWRNLGFLGGGTAIFGLLTHNNTLTALGVGGGLYSAYRYEQDRKSQSAADRRRAAYFSHRTRTISGHRYKRVTVMKKGHKYYAYKRVA